MRGSVLLIVFFSLTVTQCTLKGERPSPGNEDPHFKSTEGSIENLAHGKSSGGIVNYIKPCGIVSGVNPNITGKVECDLSNKRTRSQWNHV